MSGPVPPPPSLEEIIAHIRKLIAQRQVMTPLESLRALAGMQKRPLDVSSTLREGRVALVAPVMNTGPEPDVDDEEVTIYDPVALARQLVALGAQMLDVLTDERDSWGGLDHLTLVANAVEVPVVRHDIILDEYQVVETRAAGADGLFLDASVLSDDEMRNLISSTQRNRMTAIVQVHGEEELLAVLPHDPRVIAIDNVDPRNEAVDLTTTHRLLDFVPAHITVLSMGGLYAPQDVAQVAQSGVDAVLVELALLNTLAMALAIKETLDGIDVKRPPQRGG